MSAVTPLRWPAGRRIVSSSRPARVPQKGENTPKTPTRSPPAPRSARRRAAGCEHGNGDLAASGPRANPSLGFPSSPAGIRAGAKRARAPPTRNRRVTAPLDQNPSFERARIPLLRRQIQGDVGLGLDCDRRWFVFRPLAVCRPRGRGRSGRHRPPSFGTVRDGGLGDRAACSGAQGCGRTAGRRSQDEARARGSPEVAAANLPIEAAKVPNPFENSGVRNSCEAFAMELFAGGVKPDKLTPHLLPEARLTIRSVLPGALRFR
jgi:hypothetical protein